MKVTIDVPEKYIKALASIAALIDSEDEVTEEQKKAFLETKEIEIDLESLLGKKESEKTYFAMASFAAGQIMGIKNEQV